MRFYPDRKQAQEIDRYTQESIGIPGIVLMERAAMKLAERVASACDGLKGFDKRKKKILAVTEGGNNGGDAIAAARLLKCMGYDTYVYEIGGIAKKTESYLKQAEIAKNLSVTFIGQKDFDEELNSFSVIIDGIFGVGLTREVTGIQAEVINAINRASAGNGCLVVGCDIPSGISSDTGHVLGTAVKCSMTVTFQYIKYGCLVSEGRIYSGEIFCEDIGLYKPDTFSKMANALKGSGSPYLYYEYDKEEIPDHLPTRDPGANKGSCGKVLIVAGSEEIYGALYMCAESCFRSGAGLIRVVTHKVNRDLLMDKLPEAMVMTYDGMRYPEEEFETRLDSAIDWADVILAGPGLGTGGFSRYLIERVLLRCRGGQSIVFDADALNIISEMDTAKVFKDLRDKLGYEHVIITPHMGEMNHLLQYEYKTAELKENRAKIASEFSEANGIITILKDDRTAIGCTGNCDTGRPVYLNTTGNDGMAKGGSGDVLAGIVAGIIAQNKDDENTNYDLCCAAVNIHGSAGDKARDEMGARGMLARDIISSIS